MSEIIVIFCYYKELKNSHCQDVFISLPIKYIFLVSIKCLAPSETPTIPLFKVLQKETEAKNKTKQNTTL